MGVMAPAMVPQLTPTSTYHHLPTLTWTQTGMTRTLGCVQQPCNPSTCCEAPPTCLTSLIQLTHNGYNYRTLYSATVDGTTTSSAVEQTYAAMPANYVVSPDDSNIASQVIKPHKWDVWRLCTDNKCYRGLHYGASAGGVSDNGRLWEADAYDRYRI